MRWQLFSSGSNQRGLWKFTRESLAYASTLSGVAMKIHAGRSPLRRLWKTVVFTANGMRHRRELQLLHDVFDCSELAHVVDRLPAILEKPFAPYVCVDWSRLHRMEQLRSHFLLLKELFGKHCLQIYRPEGYQLFSFDSLEGERFSVELFPGYQSEGSIGIRLCDAENREVYAMSLHLDGRVERICYIGALQGPNERIAERQKAIVCLTRSLYGLRPKALMLETLYMVTRSLDIPTIYGVSNNGNIYQSEQYNDRKRSLVHFDRDRLWREYNAESYSPYLFKLPIRPNRKDPASLKASKRSLYRKRYDWLAKVERETHQALLGLRSDFVQTAESLESDRAA